MISKDTIGNEKKGNSNKIIKQTKAFLSGAFQVFIHQKIR